MSLNPDQYREAAVYALQRAEHATRQLEQLSVTSTGSKDAIAAFRDERRYQLYRAKVYTDLYEATDTREQFDSAEPDVREVAEAHEADTLSVLRQGYRIGSDARAAFDATDATGRSPEPVKEMPSVLLIDSKRATQVLAIHIYQMPRGVCRCGEWGADPSDQKQGQARSWAEHVRDALIDAAEPGPRDFSNESEWFRRGWDARDAGVPLPEAAREEWRSAFASCPICHTTQVVRLRPDWNDGGAIPIVGCGNPWHYATRSMGDKPEEGVYEVPAEQAKPGVKLDPDVQLALDQLWAAFDTIQQNARQITNSLVAQAEEKRNA